MLFAQDLLSWLEHSDMQNGAMPAGSPKPVNLPGAPGAAPKHQQAAEVRGMYCHTLNSPLTRAAVAALL